MTPRHPVRIRQILARLVFALLAGWVFFLLGLAAQYTYHLTHPACPVGLAAYGDYTRVQLTTADGLLLNGWWRAPQNQAVILLLGGSGANADSMLAEADLLVRHGYGVLTLQGRNCAGRRVTLGHQEANDALTMLAYAQAQPGVTWVGILGFSAGGVAALRAAAQEPNLRAVTAAGQYSSLLNEVINDGARPLSFQWQVDRAILFTLWVSSGIWPGRLSPLDDLANLRQPVYLIHGELEAANNQADVQYARANPPKSLWIVPGAGHGGYLQAHPQQYEERLIQFLDEARSINP